MRDTDLKVLIVEKERELLYSLERSLKSRGYKVSTAFDGVQGAEKILAEKFDLVIFGERISRISAEDIIETAALNGKSPAYILMRKDKRDLPKKLAENDRFDATISLPFAPEDLFRLIDDVFALKGRPMETIDGITLDFAGFKVIKGDLARKVTVYEAAILSALLKGEGEELPAKYPQTAGRAAGSRNGADIYVGSLNYKLKQIGAGKKIVRRKNAYEVCND